MHDSITQPIARQMRIDHSLFEMQWTVNLSAYHCQWCNTRCISQVFTPWVNPKTHHRWCNRGIILNLSVDGCDTIVMAIIFLHDSYPCQCVMIDSSLCPPAKSTIEDHHWFEIWTRMRGWGIFAINKAYTSYGPYHSTRLDSMTIIICSWCHCSYKPSSRIGFPWNTFNAYHVYTVVVWANLASIMRDWKMSHPNDLMTLRSPEWWRRLTVVELNVNLHLI